MLYKINGNVNFAARSTQVFGGDPLHFIGGRSSNGFRKLKSGPRCHGPKLEKAVRSHQTPESNWPSYPYMLLKICDDWKVARGWEKRALNPDSDLLTSDVEKPKKRRSLPPRRFSPTMEKRSITNGPSTSTQKCAISSEEDSDSSPDETIEDTLPALDEDLESENEVTTLRESPVQSQGKSAAEKKPTRSTLQRQTLPSPTF
ncbi:hypothetical protein OUZ56_018428 [Daphnia magna]|uniref:Uncharacterized protein n=1 Tax=Daphnia magna TaxID=35525 RepID=A0ABQ9Z8V9_9CRUS|nr:hypothetical protein OUZ56_018428 [Daphnia magna]